MDTLGLELVPWERDGQPQGLELKCLMLCFDQKSLSKRAIVFPTIMFLCFFSPRDLQHNFFSLSVFSGWSFWSPRIVFWVFFICLGFVVFCSEVVTLLLPIESRLTTNLLMPRSCWPCVIFWFSLLLEQAHLWIACAQLKFSGCALKRTWSVSPNLLSGLGQRCCH